MKIVHQMHHVALCLAIVAMDQSFVQQLLVYKRQPQHRTLFIVTQTTIAQHQRAVQILDIVDMDQSFVEVITVE